MAKWELSAYDPTTHRVRMGTNCTLETAKDSARDWLRVDFTSDAISVGRYVYEPETHWQELAVVTRSEVSNG